MLKFPFSSSLRALGWQRQYSNYTKGFKFQQGKEVFFFSSPNVHTSLGGPPTLLLNAYLASFRAVKWVGDEVDHSHPSNAKVNDE